TLVSTKTGAVMQVLPGDRDLSGPGECDGLASEKTTHRALVLAKLGHPLLQQLAHHARHAHVVLCGVDTYPGRCLLVQRNGDVLHRTPGVAKKTLIQCNTISVYFSNDRKTGRPDAWPDPVLIARPEARILSLEGRSSESATSAPTTQEEV